MGNIDYDKLLADKKLDIGVAIGYEFDSEYADLKDLLTQKGFALEKSSDTEDVYKQAKVFVFKNAKNESKTIKIDIFVSIIFAGKKHPKDTFATFLTSKEIVIYSGHARVGLGPDFDDSHTANENFIIGINSSRHASGALRTQNSPHDLTLLRDYTNGLKKRKDNDLDTLSRANKFNNGLYQVWFFNACSSVDYLDELRGTKKSNGLVRGTDGKTKSNSNLVYVGTQHSVRSDCLPFLKAILEGDSLEQAVQKMNEAEKAITDAVNKRKTKKEHFYPNTYFSN